MAVLRDKLWIWGQTPGTHHGALDNMWKLPGVNRMTPAEGCYYLGIPNCCRVGMLGEPKPPWDQEAMPLESLDKVVWSILGDTHSGNDEYLDEVLRMAKLHPNVTGAVMDDFICSPERSAIYTPERVAGFRERLHTEVDRPLDLWVVLYEYELDKPVKPWLDEVDAVTFWTWYGEKLEELEENYQRLRAIVGEEKSLIMGLYMWDYGNACELTDERMQLQLDTYHRWLHEGKIDGVIVCSNCIADVGIPAVQTLRRWVREHGDEEL